MILDIVSWFIALLLPLYVFLFFVFSAWGITRAIEQASVFRVLRRIDDSDIITDEQYAKVTNPDYFTIGIINPFIHINWIVFNKVTRKLHE